MKTKRNSILLLLTLVVVVASSACGHAKEAPPASREPASYDGELIVTPAAMEGFLKIYVATAAKSTGGFIEVADPDAAAPLKLELKEVHKGETLSSTGPGTFFVCADMADDKGNAYDVDFLTKKTARGIDVVETVLHKKPGKTFHEWVRDAKGVWARQPS